MDAEVKVPSAANPGLLKGFSFQPGVGQDMALHASPTARDSSFLIFYLPIRSVLFFPQNF